MERGENQGQRAQQGTLVHPVHPEFPDHLDNGGRGVLLDLRVAMVATERMDTEENQGLVVREVKMVFLEFLAEPGQRELMEDKESWDHLGLLDRRETQENLEHLESVEELETKAALDLQDPQDHPGKLAQLARLV